MRKKIIKLFQITVPKFYKQNAYLFDRKMKDFKSRKAQFKKSKRSSNAIFKNAFKEKQNPGEILFSIIRYVKASTDANLMLNRTSKITLFWKAFFPRILREETLSKTTFATMNNPANGGIVLKRSRGLSGWTAGTPDSFHDQQKKSNFSEPRTEDKIQNKPPNKPTEEFKGVEEEPSRENLTSNLKPNSEETQEKTYIQLPPPQKCRLSCPLPPTEFCSTEINEFRPYYLSRSVRFSSLPKQFLPKLNDVEQKTTEKNTYESSNEGEKKVPDFPKASLDDIESLEAEIRNSKNYLNVPSPKPQLHNSLMQDAPKMKALLFEPISLTLNYDAVEAPIKIFKDEVLVQVAYSGVCDTDLLIIEGKISCKNSPFILGHEISGTVYAVGSEVDHVKPGDKIAVNAYTACCVCRYCLRGLFSSCLNEGPNNSIGISKNGGWAEYVVVKKSQVHRIPDQMELDQAVLIQPISCILSAMSKLKIFQEMDILVQGLGLTGYLWTSILHSQGYKNVLVSDKRRKTRKLFESLNTNYLLVPPENIENHTVDLVVECTGSPKSIEKSLNVLNPSGQVCFFGNPYPVSEVRCIPYEIIRKEITIVGNTGNAFHFSKAVDVANTLGRRYLDFEKLGVKTFDLDDFKEAFRQKNAEEVGKIIFKFDS